jgi:PAS domain-containing protein
MPVKITPSMDALFKKHQFELFLDEMVAYTRAHASGFLARHDDARLKEIIRAIVARAEKLGFNQRASTRLYMELTWDLGWYCEHDPQYPWIGETLRKKKRRSQLEQASSLFDRLMDWVVKTCGDDNTADLNAAYARALEAPLTELPVRASHFESDMASYLERLYPKRFAYAGPVTMDALIWQARDHAQTVFHFETDAAQALVALIAFLFGHAFWQNPLHEAWAGPRPIGREDAFDERGAARALAAGLRDVLQAELT